MSKKKTQKFNPAVQAFSHEDLVARQDVGAPKGPSVAQRGKEGLQLRGGQKVRVTGKKGQ